MDGAPYYPMLCWMGFLPRRCHQGIAPHLCWCPRVALPLSLGFGSPHLKNQACYSPCRASIPTYERANVLMCMEGQRGVGGLLQKEK